MTHWNLWDIVYTAQREEFMALNWGLTLEKGSGQTLVAHTYNTSYSGGRDQEDHGSRPAWANSLQDPI
jgi:hypothetical protein